jgi:arylsulfatase A-like enzyme
MRTQAYDEHPGFDGYYASQVERIDNCFGEFVRNLKARGIYDNSIIILTSDHGDDLGEGGRWGHGYYLYPELIRIPLIIHLPPRMHKGMFWNPKDLAFLTDIMPSLYYLLGHRPIARNPIFGRPLFMLTQKEQKEYLQDSYLIGSSYGAIYGIISNNGRSLFMAESIAGKDSFFDLANDPAGVRNLLTPAIQAEQRKLVREHISEINRFYKFQP